MNMSKIEWTERTWNPAVGCDKVSAGCKECYAIRMAWRLMHNPKMKDKYEGTVEKTPAGNLNWTGRLNIIEESIMAPFDWKKPSVVFVNSMSDLFHKKLPFEFLNTVFAVMALTPHTYQVLTKRDTRMVEFFDGGRKAIIWQYARSMALRMGRNDFDTEFPWPLPNVWLGVSDEGNQHERIDSLRKVPAAVRFISAEPLILNPGNINLEDIDWVICGGESGPGARPMHPDWARSLRDQCQAAGVAFFFKQWGNWMPNKFDQPPFQPPNIGCWSGNIWCNGENRCEERYPGTINMAMVGKKKAGRLLDAKLHDEFPNIN